VEYKGRGDGVKKDIDLFTKKKREKRTMGANKNQMGDQSKTT